MTTTIANETDEVMASIQKAQLEKKEQFEELIKNNPNKRLYQQRVIIQWAEVIDIDKNSLRYVDNDEDKKYNQELMKKASTDCGLELMKFAKSIQDNEKFSIEEFQYSGREYSCEGRKDINVHAINLNEAPQEIQDALRKILLSEGVPNVMEEVTHG